MRWASRLSCAAASMPPCTRPMGMPGPADGPGVANVVAGLADPYWASSPVVSLTTSMRTSSLGRYEYQDLDQLPLHSSVTAWSKTANQPVHLEVPADVLQAPLTDVEIYAEPDFGRVPSLRVAPDPAAVVRVVDALA